VDSIAAKSSSWKIEIAAKGERPVAFLDFIKNHNAPQQQSVAQSPQPAAPSVESLQANVKAQAVDAARPVAELLERATTPRTAPVEPTPSNSPARGRSLGMVR
jgi:hypothetical protein